MDVHFFVDIMLPLLFLFSMVIDMILNNEFCYNIKTIFMTILLKKRKNFDYFLTFCFTSVVLTSVQYNVVYVFTKKICSINFDQLFVFVLFLSKGDFIRLCPFFHQVDKKVALVPFVITNIQFMHHGLFWYNMFFFLDKAYFFIFSWN